MTYFFDSTFSDQIPDILGKLGIDATHLKSHFPQGAPDATWLPLLSKNKWTLVSGDVAIAQKRARPEYTILQEAKIIAVFFHKGFTKLNRWEQVWRTIKWWPGIQQFVEAKCSPRDIVRITANGKPEKVKI